MQIIWVSDITHLKQQFLLERITYSLIKIYVSHRAKCIFQSYVLINFCDFTSLWSKILFSWSISISQFGEMEYSFWAKELFAIFVTLLNQIILSSTDSKSMTMIKAIILLFYYIVRIIQDPHID